MLDKSGSTENWSSAVQVRKHRRITNVTAFDPKRNRNLAYTSPPYAALDFMKLRDQYTNTSYCLWIFREEEWQKIVRAIVGTEEVNRVSTVRPSLTLGFIMLLSAYGLF